MRGTAREYRSRGSRRHLAVMAGSRPDRNRRRGHSLQVERAPSPAHASGVDQLPTHVEARCKPGHLRGVTAASITNLLVLIVGWIVARRSQGGAEQAQWLPVLLDIQDGSVPLPDRDVRDTSAERAEYRADSSMVACGFDKDGDRCIELPRFLRVDDRSEDHRTGADIIHRGGHGWIRRDDGGGTTGYRVNQRRVWRMLPAGEADDSADVIAPENHAVLGRCFVSHHEDRQIAGEDLPFERFGFLRRSAISRGRIAAARYQARRYETDVMTGAGKAVRQDTPVRIRSEEQDPHRTASSTARSKGMPAVPETLVSARAEGYPDGRCRLADVRNGAIERASDRT